MNVVILIPSLNPDEKLVNYVKELAGYGFPKILVVNDGSSSDYDCFFEECAAFEQCTVIRHEVNRGKGRALKTGMTYYLEHFADEYGGIVMGDADGQHALKDTAHIAEMIEEMPDTLVLGSRDFDLPNVPKRSRFGNKTTTLVFALLYGQRINDTQTGLRGIPNALMPWLIEIDGERFEYEMNMLIECRTRKVPIVETPIETIYLDDNSSSHFNPIRDSLKVYWLLLGRFIKYLCSSLVSSVVDILVYTLLVTLILPHNLVGGVLLATVIARVISSTCNFFINRRIVFKKHGDLTKSIAKYFALVIALILASSALVSGIRDLLNLIPEWNLQTKDTPLIKICVDMMLGIVSYNVQKRWVFKKKTCANTEIKTA